MNSSVQFYRESVLACFGYMNPRLCLSLEMLSLKCDTCRLSIYVRTT